MEKALFSPADPARPDDALGRSLWLFVVSLLSIAFACFAGAGLRLSPDFVRGEIVYPAAGALCAAALCQMQPSRKIGVVLTSLFQYSAVCVAGLLLTYAASRSGRPLADAGLDRLDHVMGYQWQAYAGFFARSSLMPLLFIGYKSIFIQPIVAALALASPRSAGRFETFVIATAIGLAITAALFALFPATTAWTHEGRDALAAQLNPYLPTARDGWIYELLRFRDGSMRIVSKEAGIVAFPSFHATSALLLAWTMWPVERLRVPILILNAAMILATPIVGGHYIIDVVCGALVAVIAIFAAGRLRAFMLSEMQSWSPSAATRRRFRSLARPALPEMPFS